MRLKGEVNRNPGIRSFQFLSDARQGVVEIMQTRRAFIQEFAEEKGEILLSRRRAPEHPTGDRRGDAIEEAPEHRAFIAREREVDLGHLASSGSLAPS